MWLNSYLYKQVPIWSTIVTCTAIPTKSDNCSIIYTGRNLYFDCFTLDYNPLCFTSFTLLVYNTSLTSTCLTWLCKGEKNPDLKLFDPNLHKYYMYDMQFHFLNHSPCSLNRQPLSLVEHLFLNQMQILQMR
jgi:hypothetical protein